MERMERIECHAAAADDRLWESMTQSELRLERAEAALCGARDRVAALGELLESRRRQHFTGESLDVYDDNLRPTGVKERGLVHLDGDWHRSFHCWLLSPRRGTLVVQRRAAGKATYPGALDTSVAGHYRAGEGIREGCREAEEELGLRLDPDRLLPLGRAIDASRHGILIDREVADVFLYVTDVALSDLRPDPVEVAEVLEAPVEQVWAMFCAGGGGAEAQAWDGRRAYPSHLRPDAFTGHHDRYYARLAVQARRVARGLDPLPI